MSRIIYKDEPIVEYYDDSEQMLYQIIVALISDANHLGSNLKGLCLNYLNKLQQRNQKYKKVSDKAKELVNDSWCLESGNEKVDEIILQKKKELLNILNEVR